MTTYNTGNPLGSVDVRDLYDNAQNLDEFSNSASDFATDRLGVSRQTLQGIRNASQYQVIGAYGAGLEFTSYNQIFSYMGEFYAPGPGITLPYTTTGSGAGEIATFRSVGDAVLRSDLSDYLDPAKGAALVGFDDALAYPVNSTGKALADIINAIAQGTTLTSVREYGVTLDGVTDDTAAWQAALTDARDNMVNLYAPPGDTVVTATIVYDTTGLGFYPGLRLFGSGQLSTKFINSINSAGVGGPVIRLTSGATSSDQQHGGIISGIGCIESGSGTNGHFIEYRGTWHQRYENLYADTLTGAALRCVNSSADADSSAHVNISMCRFMACAGGSWSADGGTGGVSVHTIRDFYATNCGATAGASVIIDGCVHLQLLQCSITGRGGGAPNVPLVKVKNTSIRSRCISVLGGEYGNNGGTHFDIDAIQTARFGGFRHVRRSGETNSTKGFNFADGSTLHRNVRIEPVELQIDTATPAWTWITAGTGVATNFEVDAPNNTAFAGGNIYFAGGGVSNIVNRDVDNSILLDTAKKRLRASYGTPGNITLDLSTAYWHQINFTGAGSYTLVAPINGARDGREFELTVINSVSATLSFSSDFLVNGYVNNTTEKSARFRYDSTSAKWKQMGAWSA